MTTDGSWKGWYGLISTSGLWYWRFLAFPTLLLLYLHGWDWAYNSLAAEAAAWSAYVPSFAQLPLLTI